MPRLDQVLRRTSARGTRHRPGQATPDPGDSQLLSQSDFTYLGAYKVPRDPMVGYESFFGNGLALRYEGPNVHLLSAGFKTSSVNHGVYEWGDVTPSTGGADPTNPASYTTATVLKAYGDVYSGKKNVIYKGVETELITQLDGTLGLHWDDVDQRLYWCYGFGYSDGNPLDVDSWNIGYSTLDYAAGTGAGFGPWRLSGQSWKAAMGGFVAVPSAYATTYLGGKRLAVGLGGYYSVHAIADASMGPSLTAIDPVSASEETALSNTPLVGYWPFATSPGPTAGRCNRPEDMLLAARSEYVLEPSWPANKMSWNDRVEGAVWIDTGTKRGVVFVGQYGRDYTQYVSSDMYSSRYGHYWAVYDPDDFTPASGTERHAIQPASIFDVTYPTVDYTQTRYAGGASKSVSSITSVNGQGKSTSTGATVTVPGHGYAEQQFVEIRGADQAEYNAIWQIAPGGIIDADSFYVRNASLGSSNWSGTSATGTIAAKYPITSACDRALGACFDPATNKLYVAVAVEKGVNGSSSYVFVHVYAVGN